MNRKRIRVRTAQEKRERTLQRQSRPVLAIPRPSQMEIGRKPRYVDGHEAVTDEQVDWAELRRQVVKRSHGFCECGCGVSFSCAGMVLHHWLGRTRGNSCHCLYHCQGLTPRCHDNAHKGRLGQPYRSVKG